MHSQFSPPKKNLTWCMTGGPLDRYGTRAPDTCKNSKIYFEVICILVHITYDTRGRVPVVAALSLPYHAALSLLPDPMTGDHDRTVTVQLAWRPPTRV
jgi:hypothetical protein